MSRQDIAELMQAYGAAQGRWTGADGTTEEASGTGGGLVAAVETHGVGPLASRLSDGDALHLEDAGVTLELRRTGAHAVLRVNWASGPAYEETLPVPGGSPTLPAAAAPGLAPVAVASTAAPTGTAEALFQGDPSSQVADVDAALRDPRTTLQITSTGIFTRGVHGVGVPLLGTVPAVDPFTFGHPSFRRAHGVRANYVAGAMAGGIGSSEIVIAMSKAGLLGFFGAGGLPLPAVEENVKRIKAALGDHPAGFNLLHNPVEPAVEEATVDLYLEHGCRMVSASAYMALTPAIVRYRLSGIHRDASGMIICPNKVFAKISRPETAEPFMRPAPFRVVESLVASGALTQEQAELAKSVPMAEDITAEADSGGHTDRRPLPVLLPTILRLRARVMREEGYADRGIHIRVGAAGGLGDPASVYGAFSMGADYVLTGSVNQASLEAGTSRQAKEMIAAAGMADCTTGPAPDMFELGAHVQVLGRGSMYAQRAGKLYELWKRCESMEAIPEKDRLKLEKTVFKRPLAEVWEGTREYWATRDPREVEKAEANPKHKMALTFRWYLGMTSRWARTGEADRKRDYQIWCGPSMGAFNDWVRGSELEDLDNRGVVEIAGALLHGAAGLRRAEVARALGLDVAAETVGPRPLS